MQLVFYLSHYRRCVYLHNLIILTVQQWDGRRRNFKIAISVIKVFTVKYYWFHELDSFSVIQVKLTPCTRVHHADNQ